MAVEELNPFMHGSTWVRADFHLHTKADKEFVFSGEENAFVGSYVEGLKAANIGIGIITNHNKFDAEEFKSLRKKARRVGVGLLPGVELSVNDGSNGVHTLIVFSDEWLENGQDYINQFLANAFTGKTKTQYENENGRTNQGLLDTLKMLEGYNRDFFIIFAHVEAPSGLWSELDGGRLTELSNHPLIQKYCLGFQKVRTHDKKDSKCRTKVKQWWTKYPAELEGSDAKRVEEIGRGQNCYLKLGDFTFDAVKFALTDFQFRVAKELPKPRHSRIDAVRFEGGLLDGIRVPFSPHMNCLIGIQGSGKSSVLESIRYALDIPFGEKSQDKDYKQALLPHVLKSGGKVIVEATDRHGTQYEVQRIFGHQPDVYVNGVLHPGIAVRETVVCKPLYFGQKDLSAAGKGFGQDLVEKLVGETLNEVRGSILAICNELEAATKALLTTQGDAESLSQRKEKLADIKFRLEQFNKHGVKSKLEKQVEFKRDASFCDDVDAVAEEWRSSLEGVILEAEEAISELNPPKSKANEDFFKEYDQKLQLLKKTIVDAKTILTSLETAQAELKRLHDKLDDKADGLKEEFAKTERDLVKALTDQGVTSIQPDAYVKLTEQKTSLEAEIAELDKKTSKEANRRDALLKVIARLNEAWLAEFKQISDALGKINAAQAALKVEVTFKGDKGALRDKLEEVCKGSGIRKESFQLLAEKYPDCAAIYKDIEEASKLAKGKADTFKENFNAHLFDLLCFQIPNSFSVTYHGKPLTSHSLGQRASAMMLFLLSQDENDLLLIDQPEDDLDSQTVYEEVVKLVRVLKDNRQFIFATHNANFPVLGDSEIVASCAYDEAIAVIASSIDTKSSQDKIVGIMEGGKEAFARRKAIYEIWAAT